MQWVQLKKKVQTELEKARVKVKQTIDHENQKKRSEVETEGSATYYLTKLGENLLNPARQLDNILALTYLEDSSQPQHNNRKIRQAGDQEG